MINVLRSSPEEQAYREGTRGAGAIEFGVVLQ